LRTPARPSPTISYPPNLAKHSARPCLRHDRTLHPANGAVNDRCRGEQSSFWISRSSFQYLDRPLVHREYVRFKHGALFCGGAGMIAVVNSVVIGTASGLIVGLLTSNSLIASLLVGVPIGLISLLGSIRSPESSAPTRAQEVVDDLPWWFLPPLDSQLGVSAPSVDHRPQLLTDRRYLRRGRVHELLGKEGAGGHPVALGPTA
jgi:hypothetical protein